MLNFACLPSTSTVSLQQTEALDWIGSDWGSCAVMVLSLDSLGQCVSALSKRFVAAEPARDSPVGCLPACQRDKHPEVRHRKDGQHQQDNAAKLKVRRPDQFSPDDSGSDDVVCLTRSVPTHAGAQQQNPNLHLKEAGPRPLRRRRPAQPPAEGRAQGSLQGAGDHRAR